MEGQNPVQKVLERVGREKPIFYRIAVENTTHGRSSSYDTAYLTEPDWYRILMTSRASNAEPALDFVCDKSIRR
jgi:hypothetical protein